MSTLAECTDSIRSIRQVSCPMLGRPMRVDACLANQGRYPVCVLCKVGGQARRVRGVADPGPAAVLAAAEKERAAKARAMQREVKKATAKHGPDPRSAAEAGMCESEARRETRGQGEAPNGAAAAEKGSVRHGSGNAPEGDVGAVRGTALLGNATAESGDVSARPATATRRAEGKGTATARPGNDVPRHSVSLLAARRTTELVNWIWAKVKAHKGETHAA